MRLRPHAIFRTTVAAVILCLLAAIAPGCGTTRGYYGIHHDYEYDWDGYGPKHGKHKHKKHKHHKKYKKHKHHHDRHDDDD